MSSKTKLQQQPQLQPQQQPSQPAHEHDAAGADGDAPVLVTPETTAAMRAAMAQIAVATQGLDAFDSDADGGSDSGVHTDDDDDDHEYEHELDDHEHGHDAGRRSTHGKPSHHGHNDGVKAAATAAETEQKQQKLGQEDEEEDHAIINDDDEHNQLHNAHANVSTGDNAAVAVPVVVITKPAKTTVTATTAETAETAETGGMTASTSMTTVGNNNNSSFAGAKSIFRRRKVKIPRHLKTKHRKIDRAHPEFELTYDMMLGIRTTVSMVEAKPHHALYPKDYTAEMKLRFPGTD